MAELPEAKDRLDIVVIEDNLINLELFVELLEMAGLRVVGAELPDQGIRSVRELQPRLVLLDIAMPGMSGVELAEILRADPATAAIPLVVVSAHVQRSGQQRPELAVFDGHIAKPISVGNFAHAVKGLLDKLSPQ